MMSAATDVSNKDGQNAKNGEIPEARESVADILENGNESDPSELMIEPDSFEQNDDIDINSDVWKGSDSEDETGNLEKTEQQKDPEIVHKKADIIDLEQEQEVVEPEQEQLTNGPSTEATDKTNEDLGLGSSNACENEKSGDEEEVERGTDAEESCKKSQSTEDTEKSSMSEDCAAKSTDGNCDDVVHIDEEIKESSETEKPNSGGSDKKDSQDVVLIDDEENGEKNNQVEESSEKDNLGCENDATDKNCEMYITDDKDKDHVNKNDDDTGKDAVNEDVDKGKDDANKNDKGKDDANKGDKGKDDVNNIDDRSKDDTNKDDSVTDNGTQDFTESAEVEETPMDTEDADLDDSEDFDPSLLCPEVSMAVDESPVVTTIEGGPNGSDSPLPYDEMYSSYVDEVTGAEIDIQLTQEEQDIRKRMYSATNPVQYSRIHCTACNLHLGSALETQNNRFVHPLLKVIICKKCYSFYTSGEFEKDEDGSELYCRWCGQGGQVLCCSKCEFVFCKKCIRTNCGKKKLSEIKDSDEWDCFRCNPGQIKTQKVTCAEFFDYIRRERTRASTLNDPEFMKIDYCRCCQKSPPQKRPLEGGEENKKPKPKRKKVQVDEDYDPFKDIIVEKTPQQQKAPSTTGSVGLNTIPSSSRMILPKPGVVTGPVRPGEIPGPVRQGGILGPMRPGGIPGSVRPVGIPGPVRPAPQTLPHLVMNPIQHNAVRANMPRYQFVAATPNQGRPTLQAPTLVRIGTPIVRQPPPLSGPGNRAQQGLLQDRLTQGNKPPSTPMKHEWFEKTIRASARVTAHLSYTLTQLNKSQSQASSVEELAVVHNKLQEILSSSINSLIQVRKNLRTEFINGIKTVRFPPKPIPAQPKFPSAPVHNQDDDVIFVPTAPPPVIVLDPTPSTSRSIIPEPRPSTSLIPLAKSPPKVTTPATNSNTPRGPYLKVKSFTQLQSVTADCIILPDDPEPVQPETDPLALEAEVRTETEVTCNGSAIETVDISKKKEKEKEKTQTATKSVSDKTKMDEPMNQKSKYNIQKRPTIEIKRMMSAVVKVQRDDLIKLQAEFSKKCQQVV